MQLAKVRTMQEVEGIDPYTNKPITLNAWAVGWMEYSAAKEAESLGQVQMLSGLSTDQLHNPATYKTPQPIEKPKPEGPPPGTYGRRDMQAENKPNPRRTRKTR